jgi:hypothetical protein
MDIEIAERRAMHRFPPPAAVNVTATMRPGCHVALIDVTDRGALVEAPRPLRPGATIQFLVTADDVRHAITARVLRCAVAVLDPAGGVTYRGGLVFDAPVRWAWGPPTDDDDSPPEHALGVV